MGAADGPAPAAAARASEPAPPRLRLLCLHGMGTSAAILTRQLRPLADATADFVEMVYLDGNEACAAADPAIEKVFPGGPYYRYMRRVRGAVEPVPDVTCGDCYENIDAAIAHCVAAIHELGPFDGLLGFSQGANLATIVAAHLYALGSPADAQGPVAGAPRFALLFCGTQFGWAAQLPHLFPRSGGYGRTPQEEVLQVPSWHVFGEADPFRPTSEVLSCLWAAADRRTGARLRHTTTHPAGHRPLPPGRDAAAVVESARAFLLAQRAARAADAPLAAAPLE